MATPINVASPVEIIRQRNFLAPAIAKGYRSSALRPMSASFAADRLWLRLKIR
jgi:hypothetical protein